MKLINLVKNNKTKEALEKLETISSENLNKVDSAGKNILHWAVIKNNSVLVKVLCTKLSDYAINAQDNGTMTALNYASLSHNQEIIDDVSGTQIRFVGDSVIYSGFCDFDNFEEY